MVGVLINNLDPGGYSREILQMRPLSYLPGIQDFQMNFKTIQVKLKCLLGPRFHIIK